MLLAACMALIVPLSVRAAVTNGYNLYNDPAKYENVPGVRQGDTSTDFLQAAPIATIYIDEAMIDTTMRRNAAVPTMLADTTTYPQAKGLRFGPVMSTYAEDFGVNAGNNFLIFDNRLVDEADRIQPGVDNHIPGDLASFRFKEAAETQGGELCDVIFTYSNLHIVLQSTDVGSARAIRPEDVNKLESFSIAGGNLIQVAGTMRNNPTDARAYATSYQNNLRYGMSVSVNVQVVETGTNTAVPGNFYFRIVDIDVPRPGDGFQSLFDSASNDNYSEHIQLVSGFTTDSGISVYVPGGTEDASRNAAHLNSSNPSQPGYKCDIDPVGTGYMFRPTKPDRYPDDDGSFYSGFLTVVDNSTGVNLRAWSAGCGNATVRTKLLAGFRTNTNIVYNVLSSTSPGGNIQTTTEGNIHPNHDLTLTKTGEEVIGPSKLMVSNGKNVYYTLTPGDVNSMPKEVIIDGVSYTGDALATLLGVPSVDYGTTYSVGFTNIQADHTIHVNWYHKPKYSRLYRYSDKMDLPPEVLHTIPANSPTAEFVDGTKLTPDAPSQTSLTIDGFIYTFNGWKANELTVAGSDVEFVGDWTIVPVPSPAPAPVSTGAGMGGEGSESTAPAVTGTYAYTAGEKQVFDAGSGKPALFALTHSTHDMKTALTMFTGVKVDGVLLDPTAYTLSEDGVLTLSPTLLKILAEGAHTLEIIFTDGSAETGFSVLGGIRSANMVRRNAPATADHNAPYVIPLAAVLVLSLAGLFFLIHRYRHGGERRVS